MSNKRLLYIRGLPGAGKITTAKIVAHDLGWKLLWFHDFDFLRPLLRADSADRVIGDAIYDVLDGILESGESVVYVRPSRITTTVERIRSLANSYEYKFILISLEADYKALCQRVVARDYSSYRICTTDGLDEYLSRPESYGFHDQKVIDTTNLSPSHVAAIIKSYCV